MPSIKRAALLITGFLSLIVGAIGVFIPILPTTPHQIILITIISVVIIHILKIPTYKKESP